MIDLFLGWKVVKMAFFLLVFLITLERFDTLKGYLKDKQKSSRKFFKRINKDAWDLYKYPVFKTAFYFQRHTDYKRKPGHPSYAR